MSKNDCTTCIRAKVPCPLFDEYLKEKCPFYFDERAFKKPPLFIDGGDLIGPR